jgi:UTP:GlnB (protein PII) uridylyltransferase
VIVGELADRRNQTEARIQEIRGQLKTAQDRAAGKACVYATGSFGRSEASPHSDLDLFIVGKRNGQPGPDGKEGSLLKRLDEILIKADLIQVTRKLGSPSFLATADI